MSIQKVNRKSKPFLARCRNSNGKYISATFKTRSEAEDFIAQNKNEPTLPKELRIDPLERAEVSKIRTLCARHGKSLHDAASILEAYFKNQKKNAPMFNDAADAFIRFCQKKGARPSTYETYQSHIAKFLKWPGVSDMTTDQFDQNLAQSYIDISKNKSHVKSSLRAFWSWLVASNFAATNVFWNVKIHKILKDKSPIKIMSVAHTRENLAACAPEYKPLYALMAFAGIRPEELLSGRIKPFLEASDIDFDNKKITVRAEVSKTRTQRIIMNLKPNIWLWLEPIKKWGKICPFKSYSSWRTQKKKLPHKIPQDALRHSFASYAYYALGVEHAVEILGHDYKTYKKFYKGLASIKDSEEYFKILPANV